MARRSKFHRGAPKRHSGRSLIVLLVFAVVFISESLLSYTQKSATFDEPVHVADGYFSLARGDFRFDPEHPPLLRMWAALPLLLDRVTADASAIDATPPDRWAIVSLFDEAHRFLYLQNDADHLLYRARFMVVLLGVLLGVLVYCWVNEWLGFVPGCAALVMIALEPNLVAHYSLVTTDGALTTFVFGAAYFLWRIYRNDTWPNLAGLCFFCAAAVASKYSAILLFPLVLILLLVAVYPLRVITAKRAALTFALVLVVSYAAIWASYGFRYLPSPHPTWAYALHDNQYVAERVPALTSAVRWIDAHHLLPNVFSEGFLLGQAKAQVRSSYLAGEYSESGWWYFFPYAIAIKTPVSLLLLLAYGLWRLAQARTATAWNLLLPITVFLAGTMTSHLNIGLRHALTIYPFFIVIAAFGIVPLLTAAVQPRRPAAITLLLVAGLWLFEFGRVYPHTLAFFNTLAGGPAQGAHYLVDSNLDWGQDLKLLKTWMDAHGVAEINLSYFGAADPAYYGMQVVFLNGSPSFVPAERLMAPRLPGYVAVSETNLSGVFFDEPHRGYYRALQTMTPVAVLGFSMRVYWVDHRW